jgi:hypothetical protein
MSSSSLTDDDRQTTSYSHRSSHRMLSSHMKHTCSSTDNNDQRKLSIEHHTRVHVKTMNDNKQRSNLMRRHLTRYDEHVVIQRIQRTTQDKRNQNQLYKTFETCSIDKHTDNVDRIRSHRQYTERSTQTTASCMPVMPARTRMNHTTDLPVIMMKPMVTRVSLFNQLQTLADRIDSNVTVTRVSIKSKKAT